MTAPLRVGNCSGFYGDRLSAMQEMLEGGPLDVLTGDYLAELTMLILGRDQLKDANLGYARTFVKQVAGSLRLARERGVTLVANAGGLNPAGLAETLRKVAADQGAEARIAYVDGDNLMPRAAELGLSGPPLTANAYLGAFGIARALERGADIVVTGRVTDASVVVGPAIAHFGWGREDYDALAGAVVAGHVIECGTQATGGNFSGFREMFRAGMDLTPLGFPLAEIEADGSCVITKHPGTGGVVSVDTVTAQLVYEIQSTRYLGPDVTTLLDSLTLAQDGADRVRISGVRGEAPPATAKVCVNELGGWRNQVEFVLTGLDLEAKADWVRMQVEAAFSSHRPEVVDWALARTDRADADTEEGASARLRLTVRDPSAEAVGKAFTGPVIELALASYPGFTLTTPPPPAAPYGVYRAAYVPQAEVPHLVHHADGSVEEIASPASVVEEGDGGPSVVEEGDGGARLETTRLETTRLETTRLETTSSAGGFETLASLAPQPPAGSLAPQPAAASSGAPADQAPTTRRVPLGTFVHARSGDKGGDANLGLWVSANEPKAAARRDWLLRTITPDVVRRLLPEARDLEIDVHPLPNLGGVNVLIHGLLGLGVAASSRFDPQAKGLGEWARSRHLDIPEDIL